MVEAAARVVRKSSSTIDIEEYDGEYTDADAEFDIADVYNQAAGIRVFPVLTDRNAEPYFRTFPPMKESGCNKPVRQ
jgi:hypothetical protein